MPAEAEFLAHPSTHQALRTTHKSKDKMIKNLETVMVEHKVRSGGPSEHGVLGQCAAGAPRSQPWREGRLSFRTHVR